MTQVVTNENMMELIETRKVPEFKAPEAKPDAKPAETPDAQKAEQPRDINSGKFVAADGEKVPKEEIESNEAAQKAAGDDESLDESDLPEKVRRELARKNRAVDRKHQAMKEAEEFARETYLKQRAAEERAEALERELSALKGTKSEAKDVDPDEPKPEDFKTVGEYTRALTKYEVQKAKRDALANQEQAKQQTQAETRAQAFTQRQQDFIKATPDYLAVVEEADFEVPHAALQYMVDSDFGPQLAYHIAKHPEVADRLRSLSPPRVIAELGKLEILFEKKPEPPAKEQEKAPTREVSRAPAPITPLEGKTTPVVTDPAKMSFKELREYERQREATRRGAR